MLIKIKALVFCVQPFVDEVNFLQQFFPSKALAVSIPLMMGVLGLIVIGRILKTLLPSSKLKFWKTEH